jgi:hypothetical protein
VPDGRYGWQRERSCVEVAGSDDRQIDAESGRAALLFWFLPDLWCVSAQARADGAATSMSRGEGAGGIWPWRSVRGCLCFSEADFGSLGPLVKRLGW